MLWSFWDLRWGSDEHPTLLSIREYQQSTGPISKFSHRLVALSVVMLRGQILQGLSVLLKQLIISMSITICWTFSSSGLWNLQHNDHKARTRQLGKTLLTHCCWNSSSASIMKPLLLLYLFLPEKKNENNWSSPSLFLPSDLPWCYEHHHG